MKLTLHKLIFYGLLITFLVRNSYASAQLTASLVSQRHHEIPRKNRTSLKDFLSTLERTFSVYFTFESSIIRDKKINGELPVSEDLEETLKRALYPLDLRYEKVSDKYYSIFKAKKQGLAGKLPEVARDMAITLSERSNSGKAMVAR